MSVEFNLIVSDGARWYKVRLAPPTYSGANEDWPVWVENEEGEGMTFSAKNLFDILDKEFKENF